MRWSGQEIDAAQPGALPGLASIAGLVRSVTTPEFQGITFHEVLAKSALNKVPGPSRMPFEWTVNPYRGCSHACRYCFARPSHRYLELDPGADFDQQIIVKTNVADVLRRELAKPSWGHEQVALGTNTDPYQRAEGRYRLMPGIIQALAESGTPLSVLTKGTLIRQDLELLASAAEHVPVGLGVSLALADDDLRRSVDPGAPSVRARLEVIRSIRAAGLPCGVMVAPVLPWLTDSAEHLDELLGQIAAAGATGATVVILYLRPGTKEWFMKWLGQAHPELVKRYEQLYSRGAYVPESYKRAFGEKVAPLLRKHGFDKASRHRGDRPHPVRGRYEGLPRTNRHPAPAAPRATVHPPIPEQEALF
ncbi:Rv2578c family radical SAM protein [Kribbella deserti]|uniref:Rv2578c family radical SAM protein n=1 Tax=Kribbella deserti TaxID=1926257 RepID=A0ABV6QW39_9ACTN